MITEPSPIRVVDGTKRSELPPMLKKLGPTPTLLNVNKILIVNSSFHYEVGHSERSEELYRWALLAIVPHTETNSVPWPEWNEVG